MRSFAGAILLAVSAVIATPPTPSAVPITYDPIYDNPTGSLSDTICADGPNGLLTKGFTTFSSLPTPFIGGVAAIAHFNSPLCGSCWALTLNGTTVHVLAVDHAVAGFTIAEAAYDALVGDDYVGLEVVALAQQVAPSVCGLND